MKPFTAIAIFVIGLVGLGHILRAVTSAETPKLGLPSLFPTGLTRMADPLPQLL